MADPKSGFISEDEPGAFMATVTFDHPHYALMDGEMKADPTGRWADLEDYGRAYRACNSLESAEAFVRGHFDRAGIPCPPMAEGYNEGTWTLWPSNAEANA